jgi:hypothetical protein
MEIGNIAAIGVMESLGTALCAFGDTQYSNTPTISTGGLYGKH